MEMGSALPVGGRENRLDRNCARPAWGVGNVSCVLGKGGCPVRFATMAGFTRICRRRPQICRWVAPGCRGREELQRTAARERCSQWKAMEQRLRRRLKDLP